MGYVSSCQIRGEGFLTDVCFSNTQDGVVAELNLSRVLKHLSVFVVVFLMVVAYVGNPAVVDAHRSGLSSVSSSSAGSSSPSSQQFSTVPTSIPGILSKARLLGPVSPDEQLSLEFMLPLRDPVGLQSFLSEVYDPVSSLYRHFLTPSQFYAFYGPDPNEVAALIAYVQSKGAQIQISTINPNVAEVRGTVSQIQEALKTQIDSFSWNGKVFYSATSQAQLPSLFSNIQMIFGLEDFDSEFGGANAIPLYRTLGRISPSQTLSGFPLYYSPSEISQMYNATSLLNAGYDGKGVSIAIVDAYGDPYIQQELQNFSAQFGLPLSNGTLHIIPVGSYDPWEGVLTGWSVEIALDVEWAHAMAPNATINLYIASNSSSSDLFGAVLNATLGSNGMAYGVYHNDVISMSWGMPENDFGSSASSLNYPWLDQVFQMGAALGITVFASSGDWGAYDQTYYQTSPYGGAIYPSTDPYVTGVGGTSLYMNTTSGYYQFPYANATGTYGNETAWSWNNYYGWGTGGGWSTLFSQPSWQNGPGVANNGQRGDPDVAWDADPQTGVVVCVAGGYYVVGGTSVGSPCWAGSMALLDQKAGSPLGFINPAIYSVLNNGTEYSKAFHDITIGNNNPNSATRGWDPLTGVGSPNLGELANYLANTGQLPVVVTNSFSNVLGQAYAYGQIINLTASVADNRTINGPVTATITSSTGTTIASNVTLTYNASAGAWLGSYLIKATDPSGEWSVTVTAMNASILGKGYTSFSVGDGVTIVNPPNYTGQFYQIGSTIYVDSYVADTHGESVTNGVYAGTFYLAQNQATGSGLGKIEGRVALAYSSLDSLWTGNFTVPTGADQGAWVMVVNGTDLIGNKGSAYTWINVGLDVYPFTDSPNYVLGEQISIMAYAYYEDGLEVTTGTFTAVIYDGSTLVANVPLRYSGLWYGVFMTSSENPTGFYTITVNGTDGEGNYGSFATVVRVARYSLNISMAVRSGRTPWVFANVTYPDGNPMTIGDVIGLFYLNVGGGVTSSTWFPMTYNSTAGGFIGALEGLSSGADPAVTLVGNYTVTIDAYDASGNYGNATAEFFAAGTNHGPIVISENSEFNSTNGVTGGNGSSGNPYLIAGWNVPSISISNVTLSYVLSDDYVSGSGGNGITIDTPNSAPNVDYVYAVRNMGYGLYVNGSAAGTYFNVFAGDNGKDGILIANDTQAKNGVVESVAYDNGLNGIVYEASSQPSFVYDLAIGNAQGVGLLSQDSNDTSFVSNFVDGSPIGIEVTAHIGLWYNFSYIYDNEVESNGVGIYVDGLGQNLTTAEVFGNPSYAMVYGNIALQNHVGIYAADEAVIDAEGNLVLENSIGISTMDSLASLNGKGSLGPNYVELNSDNGVQVVGQSAFKLEAGYEGLNGTFGTVVSGTFAVLNGGIPFLRNYLVTNATGISVSDTNSSFVVDNYVATNGGDGIELSNVSGGSLLDPSTFVFGNLALQNGADGLETNNVSCVIFTGSTSIGDVGNEGEENMQNGMEISGATNNVFANDYWAFNGLDGMLFNGGSSQNYVYNDSSVSNRCGYELTEACWNTLDNVYAGFNTRTSISPGAGLLLGREATDNYVFDYGRFNHNDVGVEFNSSQSNVIQGNAIWYNTMYGFYFVNGAQNDYAGNSLLGNGAPEFPTPPSIIVTSPPRGSTVNGIVAISWNESGESLAYTTVTIDGVPNNAMVNQFLWNTTSLSDGEHTVVVNVTDTGGFSASQTVYMFTDNQLLAIEATISHLNQTLASTIASEASLNATVQNLRSEIGSLNATLLSEIGSINGTLASTIASEASLNATAQSLLSQVSDLNQTLLKVGSYISSLQSQVSSLNATLRSTQADVNGMKSDGYITIAVIIIMVAAVSAAVFIIMRRRQRRVSTSGPSPVT